jgi:hypothetical protein
MKQPANTSRSELKKQPKTTPSKMATQLLLFYQTNFSTAIKDLPAHYFMLKGAS